MKKLLNQLILTSVIFIVTQLTLIVVLSFLNLNYFDYKIWLRWDSGHYLDIAKEGYELFPWIVGGDVSMYRSESLLLPFVFLLKDLKTPWMISLLAVLLSVGCMMSYLFFTYVLI